MQQDYDIIVVGAGHAGCEAACAAAQMGARTVLITMDMNKIAQMSCNPAVGGIAKGQIVREIDALGGHMGIVTDLTTIQFRMLNRSKGPAMWSPRAQCDRGKFIWAWRNIVENQPNLHIWQDQVRELLVKDGRATGVETYMGVTFRARCVIVTAGTFLNGLMHIGRVQLPGGRCAEPASLHLSESIARHGITVGRMKTGTPVRIDGRSVHFEDMTLQPGDDDFHSFSFLPPAEGSTAAPAGERQKLPCWITFTNPEVHERLRKGLPDSPLYNGQIQSVGPRYCPSIETKIVTFADKEQHQLFLEPEGIGTQEYYLNGFSSSLPIDIQMEALRLIPAFRDLQIYRPGYAIEYDYFDPTLLRHTLESKRVDGLFLAGQVNGTTGYEEAAGQGLVAGINAALKCGGSSEFVMGRDESYIGVLIDDLVTKGVDEPYRMFTSRAEFRILLRQDDADTRLTPRAYKMGLATEARYRHWQSKQEEIERLTAFCKEHSVKAAAINGVLESLGSTPLSKGCKLIDILSRPGVSISAIAPFLPRFSEVLETIAARFPYAPAPTPLNQASALPSNPIAQEIVEATEILIKYQGYIERERQLALKTQRLENLRIRGRFCYADIHALSTEARQKLTHIDPETLAQASRIPGVSPSDINVLLVLLGR